jgi:cytidyltransferase-like protein
MMNKKIVLATGGFDPLHAGHITYLKAAKKLGDILVVGVNSDDWLVRKKGAAFMPRVDRQAILANLSMVDFVISFDDRDGSALHAISMVHMSYPSNPIIFANGGDRTPNNIPEMNSSIANVTYMFGIGGEDKLNSSSLMLDEWKAPKTIRPWGYYRILREAPGMKVKELTILPGKSLRMQRHVTRAEYWQVANGSCVVHLLDEPPRVLSMHESLTISNLQWHQLSNPYDTPCSIVEIQYGASCDETDIECIID